MPDKDVILADLARLTTLIDKMKSGEITADERGEIIRMNNEAEVRELEGWWNLPDK